MRVALPLLAALALSGCAKFFDTTIHGRDPATGECPAEMPKGAAAGEACDTAEDCTPSCCSCGMEGVPDFGGAACVDNVCLAPEEACTFVVDNTEEACEPELYFQETCPDPLPEGALEGEECSSAFECGATCCTCEDGTTTYEARWCDDGECAVPDDACDEALDENPTLCP